VVEGKARELLQLFGRKEHRPLIVREVVTRDNNKVGFIEVNVIFTCQSAIASLQPANQVGFTDSCPH
jgi:hypothetical protein